MKADDMTRWTFLMAGIGLLCLLPVVGTLATTDDPQPAETHTRIVELIRAKPKVN